MYFPKLEYIQNQKGSVIVRSQVKEEVLGKLEHEMMTYITEVDDRVHYENERDSALLNALSLCPIVLNAFASRGHKNVLFVGHYDQGKNRNWLSNNNLLYQLLPIVHRAYGYDFNLIALRPPQKKNLGAMWYLYDKFQVLRVPSTQQYLHGMKFKVADIPSRPEDKFDAVIFAGVPFTDENFSVNALRNVWKKWCTEDFEIYDIFDGERTLESSKDSHPDLVKAFSLRSESDRSLGEDIDLQVWKSETFDKLKSDICIL